MFNEKYEYEEAKRDRFYENQMQEYYQEAVTRFDLRISKMGYKFAICVAEQFVEDHWCAHDIFRDLGLKKIHAYALLDWKEQFDREIDNILEDAKQSKYD